MTARQRVADALARLEARSYEANRRLDAFEEARTVDKEVLNDALKVRLAAPLAALQSDVASMRKVLRLVVEQGLHAPGSQCRRWLDEHRDPPDDEATVAALRHVGALGGGWKPVQPKRDPDDEGKGGED